MEIIENWLFTAFYSFCSTASCGKKFGMCRLVGTLLRVRSYIDEFKTVFASKESIPSAFSPVRVLGVKREQFEEFEELRKCEQDARVWRAYTVWGLIDCVLIFGNKFSWVSSVPLQQSHYQLLVEWSFIGPCSSAATWRSLESLFRTLNNRNEQSLSTHKVRSLV